jgi:hypothetical protein
LVQEKYQEKKARYKRQYNNNNNNNNNDCRLELEALAEGGRITVGSREVPGKKGPLQETI